MINISVMPVVQDCFWWVIQFCFDTRKLKKELANTMDVDALVPRVVRTPEAMIITI